MAVCDKIGAAAMLTLPLALALSACGKGDKDASLAALDAQLTNNAVDPALKGALADQIVVDPQLTGQSNRNAVRPADQPANGALPLLSGDAGKAQAEATKLAGGKLLSAPGPREGDAMESTVTLGALAREQAQRGGGNANCAKNLVYGNQWAGRLPDPFTLYPGGQLTEAAGADRDGCTLRAASFVTSVPKQGVIDYYYTQARRAGFAAEHKILGGDHVLGGTRKDDGSAYFIVFTDAAGGKTNVDIIADHGK
ncbi:MAG: hypothetical protein PSY12_13720 [bacterium]|nr:hypothetical protein [bacterium]